MPFRRRRLSFEQERDLEALDVAAHEADEKRLRVEATGSGYFFSPPQQIVELPPVELTRKMVDWRGIVRQQTITLQRFEVNGVVYREHPAFAVFTCNRENRIRESTLDIQYPNLFERRNGNKAPGHHRGARERDIERLAELWGNGKQNGGRK